MKHWLRSQLGKLIVLLTLTLNGLMCAHVHATQTEFTFSRYALEQGLPNTFILATVQDPQGFMWAATQDGLGLY